MFKVFLEFCKVVRNILTGALLATFSFGVLGGMIYFALKHVELVVATIFFGGMAIALLVSFYQIGRDMWERG